MNTRPWMTPVALIATGVLITASAVALNQPHEADGPDAYAVATAALDCTEDIVEQFAMIVGVAGDMALAPAATIAKDCIDLGYDQAYVKHIGPAYPPCPEEDTINVTCYWNAQERGNGEGTSFINYALEGGTA